MEKEEITLGELAQLVHRGFEETAKKADVDLRFDEVEKRLEQIQQLILEEHTQRIRDLEEEVKAIKKEIALR